MSIAKQCTCGMGSLGLCNYGPECIDMKFENIDLGNASKLIVALYSIYLAS